MFNNPSADGGRPLPQDWMPKVTTPTERDRAKQVERRRQIRAALERVNRRIDASEAGQVVALEMDELGEDSEIREAVAKEIESFGWKVEVRGMGDRGVERPGHIDGGKWYELVPSPTPTGVTLTVTFDGRTSPPLPYTASVEDLNAATDAVMRVPPAPTYTLQQINDDVIAFATANPGHEAEVTFLWKGVSPGAVPEDRRVLPMRLWFGQTGDHPHRQWLVDAWDLTRKAKRTFPAADVFGWTHAAVMPAEAVAMVEVMRREAADVELGFRTLGREMVSGRPYSCTVVDWAARDKPGHTVTGTILLEAVKSAFAWWRQRHPEPKVPAAVPARGDEAAAR